MGSFIKLRNQIQNTFIKICKDELGVVVKTVSLSVPSNESFGDLTSPVALTLASKLGKSSMHIANEIAEKLRMKRLDEISRVEVRTPGHVNIFFNRVEYLKRVGVV